MTNSEVIKEIKKAAKTVNLSFSEANKKRNGVRIYRFVDLNTNYLLLECDLACAYENILNDYISKYNTKK